MSLTKIRAEQISNLDYKQAVRVVTTVDIALEGGAPNTYDGVNLIVGNRILVAGQDDAARNGIYQVATLGTGSNGIWVRTDDARDPGSMTSGMIVMVTEGDVYKDVPWVLTTDNPVIINTTPLTFKVMMADAIAGGINTQVQYNTAGKLDGSANLTFVDGQTLTIGGNVVPIGNIIYNLGSSTQRWNDIYLSGNTIYLGNLQLSEIENQTLQLPANVNIGNAVLQEVAGNLTLPDVVFIGNIEISSSTGNLLIEDLGANNIVASGTITANAVSAPNAYINRGSDPSNWDTTTQMGVYEVNRSSWSGTTGTPMDSQIYVGLLDVVTSGNTTTQVFYPGTVDVNDAKIQWNRSLWNGTWTQWYKIINDRQIVDGGLI